MIGIYKFTNKLTGEVYIGQSKNIYKRYINHKNRYDHDKIGREDTYFHRMLRHYGFENFDFDVVEECTAEELNKKERYYISVFNSLYPNGYNISRGGYDSVYKKIDSKKLKTIFVDLKENKLSEAEIAEKNNVTLNTISLINRGKMWFSDKEKYPIRKIERTNKCKECGMLISYNSKSQLCKSCYDKFKSTLIPNKDELYNLLIGNSFLTVGKMFGVTDNAVRKWCDKYNIPRNAKYYRSTV